MNLDVPCLSRRIGIPDNCEIGICMSRVYIDDLKPLFPIGLEGVLVDYIDPVAIILKCRPIITWWK